MQQFKIRCSAIGKIMTNDRSGKGIGLTVYSYLDQWIKENLYERRKEFSSKQTEKGLTVEQDSLDFIAEQMNYGFLDKNEKEFSNEYLTGTPDIVLKDHLIDVKNSWDCFTFPLFESKINPDYEFQGHGYMALTGLDNYKLIYTLTNTPEDLIIREASNYCFKNNIELDDKILNEFRSRMTYDKLPTGLRIKVYEFQKDQAVIDRIYERVILCRLEIDKILNDSKILKTI